MAENSGWEEAEVTQSHYVRFGSRADICAAKSPVRFTPESDIECVSLDVRYLPIADIGIDHELSVSSAATRGRITLISVNSPGSV